MPESQPQVKDHSPKVPAAVARQAAAADETQANYIKALNGDAREEPPAPAEGEPPAPVVEEPPPAVEEPPPVTAPPEPGEETWQHRYLSLKGRFDNQVPQLKNQVQQLSGEINNLHRVLASMEAAKQAPPAPAQPTQVLITPEERTEYGEDFVNFAERIVQQSTAPLLQEIENLRGQVGSVQKFTSQEARQRLLDTLAAQVPQWDAVNNSQEFLDWLKLQDAYSGAIRQNMLTAAFQRNDTPRVVAFFKGFLDEQAVTAPVEPERDQPKPVTVPKVPLSKFAAPGRAKAAAAPNGAPAEKPIITTAQIARFYSDLARGAYRGREAEAKDNEAQIFAAQNEGRIR